MDVSSSCIFGRIYGTAGVVVFSLVVYVLDRSMDFLCSVLMVIKPISYFMRVDKRIEIFNLLIRWTSEKAIKTSFAEITKK